MKTSLTNLALISSGLTLLLIGLQRAFPAKLNVQFVWNTLPMLVAFIAVISSTFWIGGTALASKGLDGTLAVSSSFLVTLILLMPLIGFGTLVAHHFQNAIESALGSRFGYPLALFTGFISPSGNALAGAVVKMWENRELRPLLLYFLTVVPLISLTIFYIRQLGLGIEITAAMYKTNWAVAIGLMPCFWIYDRFFCR